MLQQTQLQPNHTSKTKVYFNEFVAKVLHDNIKIISLQPQRKMRLFFSFKYQKFRVRENHTITHNQHNRTKRINLISVFYQKVSTTRILKPSLQGLISSVYPMLKTNIIIFIYWLYTSINKNSSPWCIGIWDSSMLALL